MPSMGSVDIYKDWASSPEPGFDIKGKLPMKKSLLQPKMAAIETFNPELSVKTSPSQNWPLDVRGLISSAKWLDQYGLRKNRLDLRSLLASLGFRQNEDFDRQLRKPISSKYGDSLFLKHSLEDGSVYNIVAKKEQLTQVEERLQQAISLYKLRLEWLTSESRRIFGVVQEHVVTVVLDIKNLSPRQFDHFLCAVERVIKEQLSQVAKFNLVRSAEDVSSYAPECVPVTNDAVHMAIDWLWSLDRLAPTGAANTSEALLRAAADPNNEAIYLFTEGQSSDMSREVLRDKARQLKVPLHVVSYNCNSSDVITFLRELTTFTGGRFHAYAVTMEVDSYEGLPVDPSTNRANVVVRRKLYGGVPPGAGTRPDCLAIFEEMEEARNLLSQIQMLLAHTPDPKSQYGEPVEFDEITAHQRREEYMSSREWLERFGLKARKLDFYDVLAGISFRHCDGVLDVHVAPEEEEGEQWKHDAIIRPKLVNAKYCDKFAHVRWKDGRIVHVQMTPEVHRLYEQRMAVAMAAIKRRIDWLRQGSRELFGTIVEEQVYILVDSSASMEPSLQFVKDKLFVLMQEQLRHKSKINLVAFNDKAYPWKDRLVDVTESTLQSAWLWIKALTCYGSTNTLAALKFALSDRQTHAIYLLTDGRPNHPPKTVLSQVMLHNRIPVHAISFNCADKEANNFLCTLAKETGGRFHYFSETGDKEPGAPDAWESEDIRLLREEHDTGNQHLEKVTRLREECHRLAWNRDTHRKESQVDASGSTHRSSGSESERPKSAPSYERGAHASHRQSARGSRSKTTLRPIKISQPPKISHTRTSLLRTLSKSGKFSSDEWLLPETQEILDRQSQREVEAIEREEREALKHKKKNSTLTDESRMNARTWLRKYGLIPQRLTILDALAPTMVEQRPKYVPILDKEVLSRVFDDVLPIAHVSKARKGCISLVNPKAVNLEAYREKLDAAIQQYEKKLVSLIKKALGPHEVDQILVDSGDSELNPEKHRPAILEALERTGWRVSESDIHLLEKEILVARKYYAQAVDLERAGKEEDEEKRKKKTQVSTPGEGFGEVLKMHQGSGKEEKGVRKVLDTLRGQYVIARDERDGLYYPGHVTKCPNVRIAHVSFDSGSESEPDRAVPTRFCIPISGAIARPSLQLRDTVLARCNNADNGRQCYAPGIVTGLPTNPRSQAKFFTVKLFTGKKCQSLRGDIVKIGQTRYNFIVQNLCEKGSSVTRSNKPAAIAATDATDNNASSSPVQSDAEDAALQDHLAERDRLLGLVTEHEVEIGRQHRTVEALQAKLSAQQEAAERRQRELRKELRRMKRSAAKRNAKDKAKVQDKVAEHERMIQTLLEKLEERDREEQEQQEKKKKTRKRKDKKKNKEREEEEKEEEDEEEEDTEKTESVRRNESDASAAEEPEADADADADTVADLGTDEEAMKEAEAARSDRSNALAAAPAPAQDINIGEEVLARWLDDGWYYRGLVRHWHADGSYTIEDGSRHAERIWREDLIRDRDDITELQADATVVALHPGYCFSYAPAVITKILPNLWAEVRFYDGVEAQLPREECYRISSAKFEAVVRYIVDSEKQWVDQAVVARDAVTGSFHLAQVKQRIGSGKQYIVEWADGRLSTLTAELMFGAFTRRRSFRNGDRVLACADVKSLAYLPGWVSGVSPQGDKLTVRFCNGAKVERVDVMHSFWLSPEYYEQAVRYWKKKSG